LHGQALGFHLVRFIIVYLVFRVAQMADTQEIEDKTSEAISDDASQKKQETRDEMLARHR
jgi:hypothetical protein